MFKLCLLTPGNSGVWREMASGLLHCDYSPLCRGVPGGRGVAAREGGTGMSNKTEERFKLG